MTYVHPLLKRAQDLTDALQLALENDDQLEAAQICETLRHTIDTLILQSINPATPISDAPPERRRPS